MGQRYKGGIFCSVTSVTLEDKKWRKPKEINKTASWQVLKNVSIIKIVFLSEAPNKKFF